MSYKATVVKVMIASPSDVAQERRLIRDIIQEWNAIHAEDRKVILMPIGWETHASPDMSDRPQAIINKQLLKHSDLLVAVFWTRLGSPTGTAASGTVEEIEEHLASGKPTMIYFSAAPVRLDSVEDAQYAALKEFKNNCKRRGLIEEYDDLAQFREQFARHLAQTVIRQFTDAGIIPEPDGAPAPQGIPTLSAPARELLLEASHDPQGVIMKLDTLEKGTHVQVNDRQFVEDNNARSVATWRGAVDELYSLDLIEDRAGTGEIFFVTDVGYRVVDLLGGQ